MKKSKPSVMWLWVAVVAASVILDQVTKLIVVKNMELYSSAPFIPGIIEFRYILNRGAAWGMFSENRWVFLVVSAAALIALPLLLYRYRHLHFMFGFSLSLIIGGAIGNMIDRVFSGAVVDFLNFPFMDFPVFNVADICVTVGAVLMFIYLIFIDKEFFRDNKKAHAGGAPSGDPASSNTSESADGGEASGGADEADGNGEAGGESPDDVDMTDAEAANGEKDE